MIDDDVFEEYYDLPLDIYFEIMKRLPPKSLVRFTSVSKQWKSIIQSSRFISDYNKIQQQRQLSSSNLFFIGSHCRKYAFIRNNDDIGFQRRLTLPDSDDNFRSFNYPNLIGYSQGMFGFHHDNEDRLVIWNPSIRKPVIIPLPDHMRDKSFVCFFFTVVRNSTEPTIFYTSVSSPLQIYTLTTRAWRTVADTPPREPCRLTRVVTDRFIYWIARVNHWILSFDITSEQFTEVCLPSTLASSRMIDLDLSKLRESLLVLKIDRRKQEFDVWMMKMESGGVENSFTKQFTVNLTAHTPNLPTYWDMWDIVVLGLTVDGQSILQIRACPGTWEFLSYEPDSKSFKYIGKPWKEFPCLAGSYMETLLLLDY